MTPVIIGNNIRAARERKGLTQHQCAKALPVAQSTWCDWEKGHMTPRMSRLPSIAKLLGKRVADLLT